MLREAGIEVNGHSLQCGGTAYSVCSKPSKLHTYLVE